MWSPDDYVNHLFAELKQRRISQDSIDTVEQWEARRDKLRSKLIALLGGFPEQSADLKTELLENEEHETYYQERIAYTTLDHLRVPAYVLVPKRLKASNPAVIAWHGHGFGSKEIVGLHPDGTRNNADPGIHKHYALELVKRGLIVMAPETIGFGDRRLKSDMAKDPSKSSSCFSLSTKLLLMGTTLAGLRVYEAIRALDYLTSREDVDPGRVGCMGFSGGGLVASLSAAVDERIRATVLSAFTSTFKGSILSIQHCIDNYIPAVLQYGELPELIGLIAPRALFVESGTEDPLFPLDSVREAVAKLHEIYRTANAGGQLEADLFPGKHEISGRKAFDWLALQLM